MPAKQNLPLAPSVEARKLACLLTGQLDLNVLLNGPQAEWHSLLNLALAEGMAPQLYWNFSRSGEILLLDEQSQNALRLSYFSSWSKNQCLLQEMSILAGLFEQSGIDVVVLKGACYALTLYPDIGLRMFADLDLLVPVEKLPLAVEIAGKQGFVVAYPEATPGLRDLLAHDVFLRKDDLVLELHHSLVADRTFVYSVPVGWFWAQTEPFSALSNAGSPLMLSPTAQVLYAAAHAMLQHGGYNAPMRWFYDIDRLLVVYAERLDWNLLLAQARTFGWFSALAAALFYTEALFETSLPDDVRTALAQETDSNQSLVTLKQSRPATHTLQERQKLLSLNVYGQLRLFLALVLPSPAYMRWRYRLSTNLALPGAYLLRWLGILRDGLNTLISIFIRP